jgi:hypothetical protein
MINTSQAMIDTSQGGMMAQSIQLNAIPPVIAQALSQPLQYKNRTKRLTAQHWLTQMTLELTIQEVLTSPLTSGSSSLHTKQNLQDRTTGLVLQ